MRIYGTNAPAAGTHAAAMRRPVSSGFALPEMISAREARPAAAPAPAASIDALLAMQGVGDATERRRRSVQRGRSALDVLDDLKIAMLTGSFTGATMARLRAAAADLKLSSGDPGLDNVLSEIELRVEVELAKVGQA